MTWLELDGLRQNVLSQNGYGPTAPTGLGPRAPGGRGVDGVAEGRARDLSRQTTATPSPRFPSPRCATHQNIQKYMVARNSNF